MKGGWKRREMPFQPASRVSRHTGNYMYNSRPRASLDGLIASLSTNYGLSSGSIASSWFPVTFLRTNQPLLFLIKWLTFLNIDNIEKERTIHHNIRVFGSCVFIIYKLKV